MSSVKKLKTVFEDNRGIIVDIFQSAPKDHSSFITFEVGAIRANHFHKETIQYTFLISGKLLMRTAKVDNEGNLLSLVEQSTLSPMTLVTHNAFEAHTFKAVEKSTILAFACGIRGGTDYESDVFRLSKNLFEEKAELK